MPNYAIQEQNQDMVSLLSAYFRLLYNPTHAMGDASALYRNLPGLIGFWPGVNGTVSGSSGDLRDVSGAGLHLSPNASPQLEAESTSLRTWMKYNGTTQYHFATDTAFNSILGTESSIVSAIRGLTVMAWVRPLTAAGTLESIAAKFKTSGDERSWVFRRTTGGLGQLVVNGVGTAASNIVVNTTNMIGQNEWHYLAARWTPSTELKIWEGYTYGLVSDVNTTSIPATLFDSTGDLSVGAVNTSVAATNFWNGNLSLIALCRAALPEPFINVIFNMTAPLFLDSVQ